MLARLGGLGAPKLSRARVYCLRAQSVTGRVLKVLASSVNALRSFVTTRRGEWWWPSFMEKGRNAEMGRFDELSANGPQAFRGCADDWDKCPCRELRWSRVGRRPSRY